MTSRKTPIEIHRSEPWLIIAALCLMAWPRSLFSQAIEQWEKAMNEADRLRHLGQYQEAEKSYLSALEEAAKFGSQDPRLAKSLNDLAAVYKRQGKYTEAEPLYYRALAIWEKTLGPEHAYFAAGLNNLALLCGAQGRHSQAELLYRRSLAIWEKTLGPEHPNVAANLNNLAGLYRAQARYAEAEPL